MANKGWMKKEDKAYLRDMKREMMREVYLKGDPASKHITCKCGHRINEHYMGNRAMPCSKCACSYCECDQAEVLRRDKARKGSPDIPPIDQLLRKGRK
jgi:hypothetical protein